MCEYKVLCFSRNNQVYLCKIGNTWLEGRQSVHQQWNKWLLVHHAVGKKRIILQQLVRRGAAYEMHKLNLSTPLSAAGVPCSVSCTAVQSRYDHLNHVHRQSSEERSQVWKIWLMRKDWTNCVCCPEKTDCKQLLPKRRKKSVIHAQRIKVLKTVSKTQFWCNRKYG